MSTCSCLVDLCQIQSTSFEIVCEQFQVIKKYILSIILNTNNIRKSMDTPLQDVHEFRIEMQINTNIFYATISLMGSFLSKYYE